MADVVFVDGVPAKITMADLRRHHLRSFPDLIHSDHDGLIQGAIDAVYAMFAYVGTLWNWQPPQVWYDKTVLCYRLLTCWYIEDQHPEVAKNLTSLNGIPIEQKRIDAVAVRFQTGVAGSAGDKISANPLLGLRSNDFGRKALMMIQTAAKRALLRNRQYV